MSNATQPAISTSNFTLVSDKLAEFSEATVSTATDVITTVVDQASQQATQHGPNDGAGHADITGITIVVLAALLCGLGLNKLKQPAIVGYILAGVLLGPSGLEVVKTRESLALMAELGVLLLLFLIGLELSLRSFRRMWRIALFTVLFQVVASIAVMLLCSRLLGWSDSLAVLLGFIVALSSTAVTVKILEDLGELRTRLGRITVGILIAQDLAFVPMLLTVTAMTGDGFDWIAVPKIVLSIAALVWLIGYLSRRRRVTLPFSDRIVDNHDLLPLAALAFCFGWSALAGLVGLSPAYGAFIAGLIVGNSTLRTKATETSQPIQSVLMMVFFLSVGLLLDLGFIWDNLGQVLFLFFFVTVFKTVINVGFLRILGQSWEKAFLSGAVLAQIGEFSFLLAVAGVSAGVLSDADNRLVIAVTVLSLGLSPLWVITARRVQRLAQHRTRSINALLLHAYWPETKAFRTASAAVKSGCLKMWQRLKHAQTGFKARKAQEAASSSETPKVPVETEPKP